MTRFQVSTEQYKGHTVYVLRDMHNKAAARIVPGLGGNCLDLSLAPSENAAPVQIIRDLEDIDEVHKLPSRYGIPILFPWVSGIPKGVFAFAGKTYNVNEPGVDRTRHHGFVNVAGWKVLRSDCDNTAAWLTCAVDSAELPGLAQKYPSRCRMEITWILRPDHFEMLIHAQNTGDAPMPLGVGLHPYFTIPLGPKGSSAQCRLEAQVGRQWNLEATTGVGPSDVKPTEVYLPEPQFAAAARGGTALEGVKFNFVFDANPDPATGRSSASIIDAANGRRLTISASREFNKWVFFMPPDRSVMSLEPWTLAANGFNLAAKGVENTGMITLQPGEKWKGQVRYEVEDVH